MPRVHDVELTECPVCHTLYDEEEHPDCPTCLKKKKQQKDDDSYS